MSKIPVSSIMADFQTMYQQHWAYGNEVKRGQVDCSGAFVWSYKQHGHDIYHGSNRMARVEVEGLIPINVANIVPGMAAFKLRKPTDKGYALPSGYKTGGEHYNGDLNDYYHVGLVDNDTSKVLNAQSTSTGFVSSPISQNWSHVGFLKQVDYGVNTSSPIADDKTNTNQHNQSVPDTVYETAVTFAASGNNVNLRDAPKLSAKLVERVPLGDLVTVIEKTSDDWWKVKWGKCTGYMMKKYILTGAADGTWAAEIFDLTKEQAESIKREYPSARIFETVG